MTNCFNKVDYNEYIQFFFCEFDKGCYQLTLTERESSEYPTNRIYHFDYAANKYEFYIKDDSKNKGEGNKTRKFVFSIEKSDFEGFVIDEDGVIFPAQSHWDGWQEITNYIYISSNIPLFEKLWTDKPFPSKEKAVEYIEDFVKKVQNYKEPFEF